MREGLESADKHPDKCVAATTATDVTLAKAKAIEVVAPVAPSSPIVLDPELESGIDEIDAEDIKKFLLDTKEEVAKANADIDVRAHPVRDMPQHAKEREASRAEKERKPAEGGVSVAASPGQSSGASPSCVTSLEPRSGSCCLGIGGR